MSTLVLPDERTDGGMPSPAPPPAASRLATWRASWAVALRMARRDVLRHKGRSALVVAMVTLPTLLLSALVTLSATTEVTGTEVIPGLMGSGQAFIEGPEVNRVIQDAPWDFSNSGTTADGARAVPGFDPRGDAFTNADAVTRLVGSPVAPTVTFTGSTTLRGRLTPLNITALDGRVGLGEKLKLTSGRWPDSENETLVTASGKRRGLADSGQIDVTVKGVQHSLVVVGVAALKPRSVAADLVVPEPVGPGPATSSTGSGQPGAGEFIVLGPDPVTWEEVRALNEHGFIVTSAAVLRDPPSQSDLDPEYQGFADPGPTPMQAITVLGVVMLLLITTLLVGPAFAVSAARQRRTLALVASNGADTPALRRTVLAQAMVLGGLSAIAGVALGTAGAWAVVVWTRRAGILEFTGPFDLPWGVLAAILVCATASTFIAALIPARRLGRLDIVGVMRGQNVSPPPSPLVFVGGLVLAGAGAALLGAAASAYTGGGMHYYFGVSPDIIAVAGAVALVVGSLLLLPMILAGVGRVGRSLPTTLRMAARDLSRHRSRSAPSAAAVLAAVAGLTMGLTGILSDAEQRSREYLPSTIAGEALVRGSAAHLDLAKVQSASPTLAVSPNVELDTGDPWRRGEQPTEPYTQRFANVVPTGCTPARTVNDPDWMPADVVEANAGPPCQGVGTNGYNGMDLVLMPADEIIRRLDLTGEDAQAVRDGAAVVRGLDDPATSNTVRLATGTYEVDPETGQPTSPEVTVDQDLTVPVIALPQTKDSAARMLQASLLLATDTATTRDWPTLTRSITVRDPSGAPITDERATALRKALTNVDVTVERGFERQDRPVVAILIGVVSLLVLVVTLTSTALSMAEQQRDDATLAALGATRGTRRAMAAAQAFTLALVGGILGVVVGLGPGVTFARIATAQGWDPLTGAQLEDGSIIVIPWLVLAGAVIAIALVAGAIAWAGIRKAPQITRRTT